MPLRPRIGNLVRKAATAATAFPEALERLSIETRQIRQHFGEARIGARLRGATARQRLPTICGRTWTIPSILSRHLSPAGAPDGGADCDVARGLGLGASLAVRGRERRPTSCGVTFPFSFAETASSIRAINRRQLLMFLRADPSAPCPTYNFDRQISDRLLHSVGLHLAKPGAASGIVDLWLSMALLPRRFPVSLGEPR